MSRDIRPLWGLRRAVFLLNSPSRRFAAAGKGSARMGLHPLRRAFSRSYGTILPSSFARVLPSALVCSTRPPVSVWGTVGDILALEAFPGSMARAPSLPEGSPSRVSGPWKRGFAPNPPYTLSPGKPSPGARCLLRHPVENVPGTGILARCPSAAPFGLALGAGSPCPD